MSRYRDPLLNAAFDLQSRVFNLIARGYRKKIRSGDDEERSYAVTEHPVRHRSVPRLGRGRSAGACSSSISRELERNQDLAAGWRLSGRAPGDRQHSGPGSVSPRHQRAIGEVMLEATPDAGAEGSRWQCLGYASFCSRLDQDESFRAWFERLDHALRELASGPGEARVRLAALQHALIELVDFLDAAGRALPPRLRSKIDVDAAGRLGGLHRPGRISNSVRSAHRSCQMSSSAGVIRLHQLEAPVEPVVVDDPAVHVAQCRRAASALVRPPAGRPARARGGTSRSPCRAWPPL